MVIEKLLGSATECQVESDETLVVIGDLGGQVSARRSSTGHTTTTKGTLTARHRMRGLTKP